MSARDLLAAGTPRPWFVVGLPWNQAEPWINAESEDPHGGRYVCEFNSDSIADMDQYNLQADAALIVAAVNEYEARVFFEEAVLAIIPTPEAAHVIAEAVGMSIEAGERLAAAIIGLDAVRSGA